MNEFDRDDPLLDACLEEVLGGVRPPDLTARIMQRLTARGPVAGNGAPVPPPIIAANPQNGRPMVEVALRRKASTAITVGRWIPAVAAAIVLGIMLTVGVATVVNSRRQPIAKNEPTKHGAKDHQVVTIAPAPTQNNDSIVRPDKPAATAVQPRIASVPPTLPDKTQPPTSPKSAPLIASSQSLAPSPTEPPVQPKSRFSDPSPPAEIVSFVNASLAQSWVSAGVKPSPLAPEEEWCRRLYVRVLGRIPSREELQRFTADRAKNKREKLLDLLFTDDAYLEEYASHWATIWANVLIGRTGGRGESLANREGLEQYLRQSLARNKPYDQIVHELLTATGSGQPGASDYNGAVNFLLAGMNEEATLATARVSRVFLGTQLQCAQCHNHPTQELSQNQFWSLNSFFRQMKVERDGENARLVNADFSGEGQGSTQGEVFYETPTGLLKTAFPAFIDGTQTPQSGKLSDVDRRAELAKFVTESQHLPRALVNRMWAHFFGYGFTPDVDDMPIDGSSSHPELVERLSGEFASHGYDLRKLIRWIALSDPFSRSSKLADLATKDMPEAGEVALFSRYYVRQMQAEEVYNSLVQAAQIRKTAANETEVEKARVDWLAQFSRQMGTDDAEEESHFNGSMRQSLIMMNGDLMKRAASTQHDGLLKSVAQSQLKFEDKVKHLFLSALSREPNRRELDAARKILANSSGLEPVALEDIWWAVLNSNEFILDH